MRSSTPTLRTDPADLERRLDQKSLPSQPSEVVLLTAGKDKPYALGFAAALIEQEIPFEFVGSDFVDGAVLHSSPLVTFRNLRGDQAEVAPFHTKVIRVLKYYLRLMAFAVKARPRVFHILWNNKFEWFDRTILLLFYRMCGRKLVYTAHNVNIGDRDGTDTFMNRLTLRFQYRIVDAIFVHTQQMSRQLQEEFGVPARKTHVIPFPINNTVPDTDLDSPSARAKLGLRPDERVLLFYGNVAPYKGLEYLIQALPHLPGDGPPYRLLIAGRLKKNAEEYWQRIQQTISRLNVDRQVLSRIEYIPDEETEVYFKAADALVLPYTYIFQSGVLFLSYNFGLPVLAADVGSLKDEIVEGETGFVFSPRDPEDIARTIQRFFESDLYCQLPTRRRAIRNYAADRYSWSRVATITLRIYRQLCSLSPKSS